MATLTPPPKHSLCKFHNYPPTPIRHQAPLETQYSATLCHPHYPLALCSWASLSPTTPHTNVIEIQPCAHPLPLSMPHAAMLQSATTTAFKCQSTPPSTLPYSQHAFYLHAFSPSTHSCQNLTNLAMPCLTPPKHTPRCPTRIIVGPPYKCHSTPSLTTN